MSEKFTNLELTELFLRIKTIENLLESKGIVTQEELKEEMKNISGKVMRFLLEKANVPGNLDEIVKTIQDGL